MCKEMSTEFVKEDLLKALECCMQYGKCGECPYRSKDCKYDKDALSLIKAQDQKIFELENRLKECENGYEGTLFMEGCKLTDAEEKASAIAKAIGDEIAKNLMRLKAAPEYVAIKASTLVSIIEKHKGA